MSKKIKIGIIIGRNMNERFGLHSPMDILVKASGVKSLREREGKDVSKNISIISAIKEIGRDLLLRTTTSSGTMIEKTEVESLVIKEVPRDQGENFMNGLGGVFFSTLVESLDASKEHEPWKNGLFIERFNEAIKGTRIVPLEDKDLEESDSDRKLSTLVIRETWKQDESFLSFFGDKWNKKLPLSVVGFLRRRPFFKIALDRGFKVYSEAQKELRKYNRD